jgi:large conductance mechanosensitive channel
MPARKARGFFDASMITKRKKDPHAEGVRHHAECDDYNQKLALVSARNSHLFAACARRSFPFPERPMSLLTEFKKFILRGNVVDLAVGIVIGTAFGNIVSSLVKDIFMPVVGVVTGGVDVSGLTVTLYKDAKLNWGNFAQTIITFMIVGFCMFLVVKGMNALHRYILRDDGSALAEPTPTEKLLAEIRDLLKQNAPATVATTAATAATVATVLTATGATDAKPPA